MPLRAGLSALLCTAAIGGCSVETSGLARLDGGVVADAGRDAQPLDGEDPFDAGLDAGPPPDAGCHAFDPPEQVIVLDTAAFEAAEAVHRGTAVEAPGLLVIPAQPFRVGKLLARGYDGALLGDSPTLSDLPASPAGYAFIDDLNQTWSGSEAPEALLIDGSDEYTLAAEGFIRLLAGSTTVDFEPDDHGFVEIDVRGITHRAVATNATTRGRVTFMVTTDGWYPIRFAYSDNGGDSRLRLYVARDGGERVVPGAEILRASALSLNGQDAIGFDTVPPDSDPDGARVDQDDTDQSFGSGRPLGVGIGSDDNWSVRWLARWRFDAADGMVRAETDGKHRLWIQGVYYGGEYATGTADTTYSLRLAPGTNDVVYELDEVYGDASTRVRLNGSTVPTNRMWPATRFGGIAFGAGSASSVAIGAGETTTTEINVIAPAAPAATVVEVSGVIDTAQPDAVMLQYTPPGRATVSAPLRDWGEQAAGDRWVFRTVFAAPTGGTAGRWTVGARNDGGAAALLVAAGVLGHHGADPRPYRATATFVSAPQDLGARTRITSVEIDAYTLFGTSVELSVAAADDPAELASPWWYPVAADGTVDGAAGQWVAIRAVLLGPRVDSPRVVAIRAHGGACLP